MTQLTQIISPSSQVSSPTTPTQAESVTEISSRAKTIVSELNMVIQETDDPARMEQLLNINDEITALIQKLPPPVRPTLTLPGLGISFEGNIRKPVNGNGQALHAGSLMEESEQEYEDGDITPTTPRIDKGKAKAEPEPEEPEKVLSPTLLPESEDEDEDGVRYVPDELVEGVASPNDR